MALMVNPVPEKRVQEMTSDSSNAACTQVETTPYATDRSQLPPPVLMQLVNAITKGKQSYQRLARDFGVSLGLVEDEARRIREQRAPRSLSSAPVREQVLDVLAKKALGVLKLIPTDRTRVTLKNGTSMLTPKMPPKDISSLASAARALVETSQRLESGGGDLVKHLHLHAIVEAVDRQREQGAPA